MYSKNFVSIFQEIKEEEVDELAIELHNATIVLVKPLLVSKPKPVDSGDVSITGKNFKKFRKVLNTVLTVVLYFICLMLRRFSQFQHQAYNIISSQSV